jgi:hypothetical protein
MSERLKYVPPKRPPADQIRRVYELPRSMVERIFAFGQANGFQTEVEIVRHLLDDALTNAAAHRPGNQLLPEIGGDDLRSGAPPSGAAVD